MFDSKRALYLAGGGAAALLIAMVVLLSIMLDVLRDSKEHIASQDAKVSRLYDELEPVLDEGSPLLRDVAPFIDEATALAQQATPLVKSAGPLVTAALKLTGNANAILERIGPSGAAAAVGALTDVANRLLDRDRLTRALDQTVQVLERVDAVDLVGRAAHASKRLKKVLIVQRRLLSVQRDSYRVQRASLEVQLQSLDHIRSIDQKTGGDLTPP